MADGGAEADVHRTVQSGDILALPGGNALLAHSDSADSRLIAFNDDGTLRWERSIASILEGEVVLLNQGDQTYLVSQGNGSGVNEVSIYAIDLEQAELTLLFTGGTRSAVPNHSGIFAGSEDLFLIDIGGRSLTAFDPRRADQVIGSR